MARRILFTLCTLALWIASVAPARAVDSENLLVDPWLTASGPVLSEPATESAARIGSDRVVTAWRGAPPANHARAAALRRLRLEYGLGDLRAPARVVHDSIAAKDPGVAVELSRGLAPRMPALAWENVLTLWEGRSASEAGRALVRLLFAAAQDLEAQLWFVGNGLLLIWLVAAASATGFVVLLTFKTFAHAAHDLADPLALRMPAFARAALLASLLLLPLALGEGVAGFLLACFAVAFLYATRSERTALAMAAVGIVVALHPLAQWATTAADLADLDPVSRSALAVTRATASRSDLERLEAAAGEDLAAAQALVYHARRSGDDALTARRLDALIAHFPGDPVALANLGNLEMRAGRATAAIDYYERAATQSESPALFFDLSQAYSSALRIDDAEAALARAQRVGDAEVAALSSLSDPRLVADLGFPEEAVRERLRKRSLSELPAASLTRALAPGRLGDDGRSAALGFAIAAFAGLLLASRFDRSGLCQRCGHRICTRCDETVWSDDLCDDCHHLFKNPESTDPKLRLARLAVLSKRDARRAWLLDLGTLVVPGVAGLAIRRPDLALSGMALAAWVVAWRLWPEGPLVDSTWLGPLAPLTLSVFGLLAAVAYTAIVLGSLAVRRQR